MCGMINTHMIDGALCAPKDYNAPKHTELEVPNLEVIKIMQSLTSKGLVKTQFSWQWYYYTLTDEGIDYLRECKLLRPAVERNLKLYFSRPPLASRNRPRYLEEDCSSCLCCSSS